MADNSFQVKGSTRGVIDGRLHTLPFCDVTKNTTLFFGVETVGFNVSTHLPDAFMKQSSQTFFCFVSCRLDSNTLLVGDLC